MRFQKLLIVLIIMASLIPVWFFNQWLQKIIAPRKSFGRFMMYLLISLAIVFLYTFLIVLVIANLFPLPKH